MLDFVVRKILVPVNGGHRTATLREFGPEDARVTIFYIHRFGGGGLEFSGPAEQLVEAGHRVCCLDLFGHEASQWLEPDEYSPNNDISSVRAVLRSYSDRPMLVVGNGWGGHIALHSIKPEYENLIGIYLFDYVNTVQYAVDIVMPLEHSIADIATTDLEQFERELRQLSGPYGRFGKFVSAIALQRVQELGNVFKFPVHAAAFRQFFADPSRTYSSGAQLVRQTCPVAIINGRLAEFKNLIHPPKRLDRIPKNISTYTSPKMGFLTWNAAKAVDQIIEFLSVDQPGAKDE